MPHLTEAANALAPAIVAADAVNNSLRRLAALTMNLNLARQIEAQVRWAWEKTPAI
jgi:hypothetical protein